MIKLSWRENAIQKSVERIQNRLEVLSVDNTRTQGLIEDLSIILRSAPEKKDCKQIAEAIQSSLDGQRALHLIAVLASPTARSEAPYFLKAANILRDCLSLVNLDVVLVTWNNINISGDNIREVKCAKELTDIAEEIGTLMEINDWPRERIHIFDPNPDSYCPEFSNSRHEFIKLYNRIKTTSKTNRQSPFPKNLSIDINWIKGFYSRQDSLSRLSPQQPVIDLAIRRIVGRLVSNNKLWPSQSLPQTPICITSELTSRLCKCYRFDIANLNIQVK